MMFPELKSGDSVWIVGFNNKRRLEYVDKVGRKWFTIQSPYDTTKFSLEDGSNNTQYNLPYARSEAYIVAKKLREQLISDLRGFGLEISLGWGKDVSNEQLQAVLNALIKVDENAS